MLAAAGTDSVGPLASAELYDEATDVWTLTASLNQARSLHTGTLLANGKVLVAGGEGIDGTSLGSSEVFAPGAL